jgi:glycosyltransferase involved in cell wall biosynthesis
VIPGPVAGPPGLRVALVHDFLLDLRGAERVFLELCAIWPQADVYTAVYNERGTQGWFAGRQVRTSFLQHLRPTSSTFRALLPFYPRAIESLDLSGYDLVISSSSAWAHGVICDPRTVHVCYCHNPFRYAWTEAESTVQRYPAPLRPGLRVVLERWRHWDRAAAQRVDRYLANSTLTAERIAAFYGREATVVYPPVRTERFTPSPVGDHYAIVSELIAHKRIDVAIEAFNRIGRRLVVIGDGPQARRLQRLAGPTIEFVGRISDAAVADVLSSARALVVTSHEEFGIAAVETLAAGRPVIARRAGGPLETIEDGVTGCFWAGGADQLSEAVLGFDDAAVDPQRCRASATPFNALRFREDLLAQVRLSLQGRAEGTGEMPGSAAAEAEAAQVNGGSR